MKEQNRFRDMTQSEMDNLDPQKYLQLKIMEIIGRIEKLARNGKPEETVKLKANQVLLNKIMPDMNRLDLDIKSVAPYEALKKAIEEIDNKKDDLK